MSKVKTRPQNNFHCFEGVGLQYWRSIAQGLTPAGELVMRPGGAWWEYKDDIDGYALQNGGMENPRETKLEPNYFYRFFGTVNHNLYGAKGGLSGGWWVDYENYRKIVGFAGTAGLSLAQAAARLLVIPREWHDCGYVGCALLRKQMKAFVGRGLPATGGVSPASGLRDRSRHPVTLTPGHLDMKQYFVPGSRAEIASAFEAIWTEQVIKPGVTLPD